VGTLVEVKSFGMIINFVSTHNNSNWNLVAVYGPCQGIERDRFVHWLYNIHIPVATNWLFMGDFNFIRSPEIVINLVAIQMICVFLTKLLVT
jgi:hypothetical protein